MLPQASPPTCPPARPLRLKFPCIGRQDLNGITSVALPLWAAGEKQWIEAGAPSRFEHTYDQAADSKIGTARTVSRYNLSWRLSPAEDGGRAIYACSPLQPVQATPFGTMSCASPF